MTISPSFDLRTLKGSHFYKVCGKAMLNEDRASQLIRKKKEAQYGSVKWVNITKYLDAQDQANYVRSYNVSERMKYIFCQTNYAIALASASSSHYMDLHYPGTIL